MHKIVNFKACEVSGRYLARRPLTEEQILKAAQSLIKKKYSQKKMVINNPSDIGKILPIVLANYEHEVFVCFFLNTKHQLIEMEEMFRGTIDSSMIHPREVVKKALQVNAAAVIFAHNHPSGNPEPSGADISITKTLIEALGLVDVRVLDHFIVGGNVPCSLAELGYI